MPEASGPPARFEQSIPHPPFPPPPPRKRNWRLIATLAAVLVVILGCSFGIRFGARGGDPATARIVPAASTPPPWSGPLLADEIFPEELSLDDYGARTYDLERDGSWTHQGDCPESARTKATEKYLDGCDARIEATYKGDGFRVSFHVFAFPRDENLTWDKIDEAPDDFEVRWKARSEMSGAFWWYIDKVGPFLLITHVGPTGTWTPELDKVSENLSGIAGDELLAMVTDTMF